MEISVTHSRDGIPQKDPDSYWLYRFNLMLDASSAIHGFLDLLVDYRQKRKLTQFLLCCCDVLEIIYDCRTELLLEYRFRIDLSDRITMLYSSRIDECCIYLDGKRESLPTLTLRKMRGMSQEQLAEKAAMSRSHLSAIEAPGILQYC